MQRPPHLPYAHVHERPSHGHRRHDRHGPWVNDRGRSGGSPAVPHQLLRAGDHFSMSRLESSFLSQNPAASLSAFLVSAEEVAAMDPQGCLLEVEKCLRRITLAKTPLRNKSALDDFSSFSTIHSESTARKQYCEPPEVPVTENLNSTGCRENGLPPNGQANADTHPQGTSSPSSTVCLSPATLMRIILFVLGNVGIQAPSATVALVRGLSVVKPLVVGDAETMNTFGDISSLIAQCTQRLPIPAMRAFLEFWDIPLAAVPTEAILELLGIALHNKQYADCFTLLLDFKPYNALGPVFEKLLSKAPFASVMHYATAESDTSIRQRLVWYYTYRDHKAALRLVKKFGFSLWDYPELVVKLEKNSVIFYLYASRMDAQHVADLFEGKDRLLCHLLMCLCEQYRARNSDRMDLAVRIHYTNNKIQTKVPSLLNSQLVATILQDTRNHPQFFEENERFLLKVKNVPTFPLSADARLEQGLQPSSNNVSKASDLLTLDDLSYSIQNDVIWIDTVEDMGRTLDALEATAECVALDSEWRPKMSCYDDNSAALLQIAPLGGRQLYILDLFTMGPAANQRLGAFFRCPHVVKMGLVFQQSDWREFQLKSRTDFTSVANYWEFSRILTVPVVANAFPPPAVPAEAPRAPPGKFKAAPSGQSPLPRSLTALAERILKKKMDKSCQLTNWEKRPLPLTAACYAALDVAVLIRMLEEIIRVTGVPSFRSLMPALSKTSPNVGDSGLVGHQKSSNAEAAAVDPGLKNGRLKPSVASSDTSRKLLRNKEDKTVPEGRDDL